MCFLCLLLCDHYWKMLKLPLYSSLSTLMPDFKVSVLRNWFELDTVFNNFTVFPANSPTIYCWLSGSVCRLPAVDCRLGEWLDWGKCTKECGWGSKERRRHVTVHPSNGGKKCDTQLEKTFCYGVKCKTARHSSETLELRGKTSLTILIKSYPNIILYWLCSPRHTRSVGRS